MLRAALPVLLLAAGACTPGARASAPPAPAPSSPPPAAAPVPAADPYAACRDRSDAEACAAGVERGLLAAAGAPVRREGERLLFRGAGRGSLALENDAAEGERFVRYRYAGWLPDLGQHLVQMGFYEGGGWLLVGGETTDQTRLIGRPAVSPDRARFVAVSVDLEAGYDPNGVQVWSLARGFPRLEWGLDGGDSWGASDPVWIDARTVEFTRHVNTTGDPDRTRRIRTRLVLGEDAVALAPVER